MYAPALVALPTLFRKGTYGTALTLYTNQSLTVPFNLTGYTVELELTGWLTLTESEGLTIEDVEGHIAIGITATETESAPAGESIHAVLRVLKEEVVSYLAHGTLPVRSP